MLGMWCLYAWAGKPPSLISSSTDILSLTVLRTMLLSAAGCGTFSRIAWDRLRHVCLYPGICMSHVQGWCRVGAGRQLSNPLVSRHKKEVVPLNVVLAHGMWGSPTPCSYRVGLSDK